jgi:hypothetical protein
VLVIHLYAKGTFTDFGEHCLKECSKDIVCITCVQPLNRLSGKVVRIESSDEVQELRFSSVVRIESFDEVQELRFSSVVRCH